MAKQARDQTFPPSGHSSCAPQSRQRPSMKAWPSHSVAGQQVPDRRMIVGTTGLTRALADVGRIRAADGGRRPLGGRATILPRISASRRSQRVHTPSVKRWAPPVVAGQANQGLPEVGGRGPCSVGGREWSYPHRVQRPAWKTCVPSMVAGQVLPVGGISIAFSFCSSSLSASAIVWDSSSLSSISLSVSETTPAGGPFRLDCTNSRVRPQNSQT